MKELLIISGKGGTGKTSITGAFAALTNNKVIVDCDVDASNLHLLLDAEEKERHEFYGGKIPVINQEKCVRCGKCQEFCRFSAIENFQVVSHSCEGCLACYHLCPVGAIEVRDRLSGHWFVSDTPYGPLVHARLGVAEENSGKLVSRVRKAAREIAETNGFQMIITDGPPGIGCPVISSLSGVDLALVVTEPTISGIHDLKRVLQVTRHFDIQAMVCINKYDIDLETASQIEQFCQKQGIEVAGRLDFDADITKAMVEGKNIITAYPDSKLAHQIFMLWERVSAKINN